MKQKTLQDRLSEIKAIYEQIFALGLPPDIDGIVMFRNLANHFVKTGEGASGNIPLKGYKRVLVYKLSNQAHITSTVILKHAPHV